VEEPSPTAAPAPASASGVDTVPSGAQRGGGSGALVLELRGAYSRGFEASWFEPCDAPADDRLWWVTLTDQALRQRDSLLKLVTTPATGALAVRWRGSTSPRMPAGQMGRGTRYLLVTEVLEVKPLPGMGACGVRKAS
jgi:hypothetical protein